jgi:hypothetical protein
MIEYSYSYVVLTLCRNHLAQQQEMVVDVCYQAMEEMNRDNVEYRLYE